MVGKGKKMNGKGKGKGSLHFKHGIPEITSGLRNRNLGLGIESRELEIGYIDKISVGSKIEIM